MVQEERDMSDVPGRRMRLGWIGLGMAGLLLSGCAGTVSGAEDLRVTTRGDGPYLFTRSTAMARSVCIAAGLDAARVEGRPLQLGNDVPFESGIQGCQMQPRNLIICQEGAADYAP
jgi:hypothetical protein